jgi:hypothetical protein
VDELKKGLNENGCYTLGYADGIATVISRKFSNTISELLQESLGTVQQWCDRTQLSVSQSTKDGNSVIQKEKRFKGPKGTNHLWT